jgi:hypothetical protein
LQPALLLIDAADVTTAKFVSINIPVLAEPTKYTQAQRDSLEQELKPKLDYRFSENGISQRSAVQINTQRARFLNLSF